MESLTPVMDKKRPSCPFYGFYMAPGVLLDSEGNQCALIINSYSPCQMEMLARNPDWKKCPHNNIENKKKLEYLSGFSVFPKEFWPEGKTSWDGMPFEDWQEYVTKLSA